MNKTFTLPPPPNRIMSDGFWSGPIETDESKKVQSYWRSMKNDWNNLSETEQETKRQILSLLVANAQKE